MKKIASLLILVFAFSLTMQAQKKRKRMPKEKLTVEQQATLAVKKMALELELTAAQQRKLTPIITKQITERRAQGDKMRKAREEKKKVEATERYDRANKMLDKRLAFQKEMKSILTTEQFEKFKEKSKKREKGMKMMKKKKKMKHLKEKKKEKENE
tara:strand:- start:105 stop:572 length:468 start_codon:yes stop_codon:yes gene_type:complete